MIDEHANNLDLVFIALANERRRQIIYALGLQPASIKQLATQQKISLPAIHRHIKVLEQAQLIERKKSGRVNFLTLNRAQVKLLQNWIQQYHTYWGSQEETLENYVARAEKDEHNLKEK